MRAFDSAGIAAALLLVPLVAWLAGRFAGRRDWRIGSIVLVGLIVAAGVVALVLAGLALRGGASFERRLLDVAASLEFPAFLLALSVFMTMLGWSATPKDPRLNSTNS